MSGEGSRGPADGPILPTTAQDANKIEVLVPQKSGMPTFVYVRYGTNILPHHQGARVDICAVSGSPYLRPSSSSTNGSFLPSNSVRPLYKIPTSITHTDIPRRLPNPSHNMASLLRNRHDPNHGSDNHPPRWQKKGQDDRQSLPPRNCPNWSHVFRFPHLR